MNKIAFIILSFFALNTYYAQDSLHFSSVSLGASVTGGGNYYNLSAGMRYNRFELYGGINIQMVYKNSFPVSKQQVQNSNYPRNFIGYQTGLNYYLNQSKTNHILGLRYQYNIYNTIEGSRGTDFWIRENVIKQYSLIYKISFLGSKQISIDPWLGYNITIENNRTCCLYKSLIIGLDITLRPYYFK